MWKRKSKNPDGQQVMLYKIYSGGLTFTYGNIDDIKIRGMESTYTGSTTVSYYRILSQLANGTFHPTKTITKKEWHDSVREFKKRYNNDK